MGEGKKKLNPFTHIFSDCELKAWAWTERLTPQTMALLAKQGFTSLAMLKRLKPEGIDSLKLLGLILHAQCRILTDAVVRLSEGDKGTPHPGSKHEDQTSENALLRESEENHSNCLSDTKRYSESLDQGLPEQNCIHCATDRQSKNASLQSINMVDRLKSVR